MQKINPTSALYDRFGWYWQPESWLSNLSAQDVTHATTSSTHISQRELAQKARTKQQVNAFNQAKRQQLEIIKQIEG